MAPWAVLGQGNLPVPRVYSITREALVSSSCKRAHSRTQHGPCLLRLRSVFSSGDTAQSCHVFRARSRLFFAIRPSACCQSARPSVRLSVCLCRPLLHPMICLVNVFMCFCLRVIYCHKRENSADLSGFSFMVLDRRSIQRLISVKEISSDGEMVTCESRLQMR